MKQLIVTTKKDGHHFKFNGTHLKFRTYDKVDSFLLFHDRDQGKMAMIDLDKFKVTFRIVNLDIIDNKI